MVKVAKLKARRNNQKMSEEPSISVLNTSRSELYCVHQFSGNHVNKEQRKMQLFFVTLKNLFGQS